MNGHPLDEIMVADFGQFIAGAAVGQALAELGATVIKIEPTDGEPARSSGAYGQAMVRTNNRDKLALAVDLRSSDGLEVATRLVAASDVVIENMRVGAMERLGLGPARAMELNARCIYLSITGFGKDASATRPGFDIAAQAESGIMSVTGEAGRDPQRVGFTVVDQMAAYVGSSAVLAALFRRERTGRGAVVDTSLLATAVHAQGANWSDMFASGVEPHRCGNPQPSAAPAAEVIEVSDGLIVVSAYTPGHWLRLCGVIGRPDMAHDPSFATNAARVANRAKMCAAISEALSHLTKAEAVALLNDHGVVAGEIRGYGEVVDSEDVQRLGIFRDTASDDGDNYRYVASPFSFRDIVPSPSRPAPAVGADTVRVLRQLGYDTQQIEQLRAAGVVAG